MINSNKISSLLVNKLQTLIKQTSIPISNIIAQTGIENVGQPNVKIPDTCLPSAELQYLSDIRNNIVSQLNSSAQTVETLTKPLNSLDTFVNTTSKSLETISTARKTANIAITFVPSPPGVPGAAVSSINALKDLEEFLTPQLNLAKNNVNNISVTLDYINNTLFNIINIINSIDAYLIKCGVNKDDLTSLNDYLKNVEISLNKVNQPNSLDQIYKGFILEIVEEPYSPTVNRRKAVAKNNNGIILLQTPLSFTTIPQVLIEELKLIIDSSDLKAY